MHSSYFDVQNWLKTVGVNRSQAIDFFIFAFCWWFDCPGSLVWCQSWSWDKNLSEYLTSHGLVLALYYFSEGWLNQGFLASLKKKKKQSNLPRMLENMTTERVSPVFKKGKQKSINKINWHRERGLLLLNLGNSKKYLNN